MTSARHFCILLRRWLTSVINRSLVTAVPRPGVNSTLIQKRLSRHLIQAAQLKYQSVVTFYETSKMSRSENNASKLRHKCIKCCFRALSYFKDKNFRRPSTSWHYKKTKIKWMGKRGRCPRELQGQKVTTTKSFDWVIKTCSFLRKNSYKTTSSPSQKIISLSKERSANFSSFRSS